MDFVVAQLALVFLPGIIWANLDSKYVTGGQSNQFNTVLKAFSFGLLTYGVLYLIYSLLGYDFSDESFSSADKTLDITMFIDEILWSVPLAIGLAIFWMFFQNYRIFMRFLQWIGATKRFGDQDVWTFTFNSNQPHVEYVNVRNTDIGVTYSGWVNSFSEKEEIREILLEDAYIYGEDGKELARVPHLYLSLPKSNIWLEFPYTENEEFYDGDEHSEEGARG
ncbi:DUF6338 family protein [Roseobacter sp. MH60115]|uniref:DUF6338 family protein n=1 Tax=Roseobacter sp. MH60115 TaxID=2785324 RepID=UPI0018A2DCD9|nr:DUF6338 family protein [Roseobacter sp. MH60115]